MKVKEIAKINIELSQEEWQKLTDAEKLINKIADTLDGFGVFTEEYEKIIQSTLDGIADIETFLEEGFERETNV